VILLTPVCEMPAQHRQLCTPCPKASGNVFQALVDPPHDGNNLSFDGGDEKTDGSNDNTVVITNPCESGLLASQQLQKDIDTLSHLDRTTMVLAGFQTTFAKLVYNYDRNDLYMRELNRKHMAISARETNAHDDIRACVNRG
jgi:hypothetical protein